MMMGLYEKLMQDYKQAMKDKLVIKKSILNFVIAQLKNKKIEIQKELKEEDIIQVIKKEIKTRNESIVYLKQANNEDEAQQEYEKIEILETYLPEMMKEEDLSELVKTRIKDLAIVDLKSERGKLIASIMGEYRTVIDGTKLNNIINDLI